MMPMHYWRIHRRVCLRVWNETPSHLKGLIAADVEGVTEASKWFEKKVREDATRLFEDANYYDNAAYSFKMSRFE